MKNSISATLAAGIVAIAVQCQAQVPLEVSGIYVGTLTSKLSSTITGTPVIKKGKATLMLDTTGNYTLVAPGILSYGGVAKGNASNVVDFTATSSFNSVTIMHFAKGKSTGTVSVRFENTPSDLQMNEVEFKLKRSNT